MLEVIFDEIKRIAKSRLFPIMILFGILFVILLQRMFVLQVVNGEKYKETTEIDTKKTIDLKAPRGIIYDRNGVALAYNELSYVLQIEDSNELKNDEEKNEMIYNLIHYVEGLNTTINYDFPMKYDGKGRIQFTVEGNSLKRFKVNAYSRKNMDDLTDEIEKADAKEVFDYLIKQFKISETYSADDTLKIMSIRYILYINRYNKKRDDYIPITLAANLSEKLIATLKENRAELPGVEIVEETKRVYKDSQYYASILGYTGTISQEVLQEKEADGDTYYSFSDQIGKSGMEEKYEEELRGVKGSQTVSKNSAGNVTGILKTVQPKPGKDLYLTIDSELQKASYILLEKELTAVLLERIWNSKSYGSKGKSSDDIMIPIYDVYFALLDNNVIDIDHFNAEDATELEKSVYSKYVTEQKRVIGSLKSKMAYQNHFTGNSLSSSMSSYMEQIYQSLKKEGVLLTKEFDKEDETYKKYVDGKTGLNSFLVYALEKNWINLSSLSVGDNYFNTEELYEKLLDYTFKLLKNDSDFSKLIYYNMINSFQLSGRDVCLLLFDQGVLKKNETSISSLKNGTVSAYSFIRDKIKKLEITPAQLALEPCSGSVIITDPDTGDTLACVTYPSYDNNRLANTVDSKYFSLLQSYKSKPFLNRASKQLIAPGSTFKTFSSIVALKEGVITPETRITDRVIFTSIHPSPSCWSKYTHGSINVSDAIGVSCNYFYYTCGFNMSKDSHGEFVPNIGLKKIQKYAKEFGLTDKSGLEMSEDAPAISNRDPVRSMIGQGDNLFAPVQLARWVTTIANNGTSHQLTLIDKVADKNGKSKKKAKEKEEQDAKKLDVSDSYWSAVKLGMNKVVNGPHSSIDQYFKGLDVTVAGKTGTSQITKKVPNNALFISFAPYEKPEITTTVVIPNGYTSANAAQTASKIYEYYFAKTKKEKTAILKGDINKAGSSHSRTD
ncbi:penicillin-binding transpeptidase domain-containing protein [[Clostridium] polysaccharolyticum]|uniref:Penicillin-binding protein 2 n=1 Tax=[Clostridium] polysaccharolyticum TaxID=29364 RepID=A0A1I0E4N8_9FIRM|nr:penicillin-binding transpeptidase domain-containing protein [[Clostridium] polysaccharolyticum]SET39198.1 penicillin-binding protein 2 [[Clostridium] polysaccharolyticum]